MNLFKEGIENMYEQENEEKLWQLYLHSYQSMSFDEWKKKHIKTVEKELTETEITTMLTETNEILSSFTLKKEGELND